MLDKVVVICPNIGIVYSGMGPDFRVLISKARKSAQAYWKMYGEYPPTRILTQEIATVMQRATQSGCGDHLRCIVLEFLKGPTEESALTAYHFLWQVGTSHVDPACTKSTLRGHFGRGKQAPLGKIWLMRKHFLKSGQLVFSVI